MTARAIIKLHLVAHAACVAHASAKLASRRVQKQRLLLFPLQLNSHFLTFTFNFFRGAGPVPINIHHVQQRQARFLRSAMPKVAMQTTYSSPKSQTGHSPLWKRWTYPHTCSRSPRLAIVSASVAHGRGARRPFESSPPSMCSRRSWPPLLVMRIWSAICKTSVPPTRTKRMATPIRKLTSRPPPRLWPASRTS